MCKISGAELNIQTLNNVTLNGKQTNICPEKEINQNYNSDELVSKRILVY